MLSRVARVVAPKKAALKEAEAELAVAMEVSILSSPSPPFSCEMSTPVFCQET